MKYIVQLSDVNRMKFEHHEKYSSKNIVHCSFFYWKLNKPYYMNQSEGDGVNMLRVIP